MNFECASSLKWSESRHGLPSRDRDTRWRHGLPAFRRRDGCIGLRSCPLLGSTCSTCGCLWPERVRPVLNAAPDWADQPRSHGGNGTPILFPFPNRIRGAQYTFEGKEYQLEANNGANAIHGFAIQAPWDVVEHRVRDAGATIIGLYQISRQSPDQLKQWPADATLQIQYTLAGRKLSMEVTVTNPTANPLPYGFGIHPYFRMPFEAGRRCEQDEGDPARLAVLGTRGVPADRRAQAGRTRAPDRLPQGSGDGGTEARRRADRPEGRIRGFAGWWTRTWVRSSA